LVNAEIFPIISVLLPSFITNGEDHSYTSGTRAMESYKWLYNIDILWLYVLVLESIKIFNSDDVEELEMITELQYLERPLFARIYSSIRHHLRKTELSISKKTYCGFDTEFHKKDIGENILLSAQLAVA
jgi:uncharacterized membrane protein